MKRILIIVALLLPLCAKAQSEGQQWPSEIYSKIWKGTGHCQGIATDGKNMYFSFTTALVKTDMQGKLLGAVTGLTGHLGCLAYNPADGKVYGSLEYKNDAIGKGILQMQGSDEVFDEAFYIAIFDPEKITRRTVNAEADDAMQVVYIPQIVKDYKARVSYGGKTYAHFMGCAGIDGVTIGPKFGRRDGKLYLTMACGVYGDNDRTDNDYQLLLSYDLRDLAKFAYPLSKRSRSGPSRPVYRYFVHTGNTNWGTQNLEYDSYTNHWFLAVYKGHKPQYPNPSLFVVDGNLKPRKAFLEGVPYVKKRVRILPLLANAEGKTDLCGWNSPWGTTGMISLGDGLFYISQEGDVSGRDRKWTTVKLCRFDPTSSEGFQEVK